MQEEASEDLWYRVLPTWPLLGSLDPSLQILLAADLSTRGQGGVGMQSCEHSGNSEVRGFNMGLSPESAVSRGCPHCAASGSHRFSPLLAEERYQEPCCGLRLSKLGVTWCHSNSASGPEPSVYWSHLIPSCSHFQSRVQSISGNSQLLSLQAGGLAQFRHRSI